MCCGGEEADDGLDLHCGEVWRERLWAVRRCVCFLSELRVGWAECQLLQVVLVDDREGELTEAMI